VASVTGASADMWAPWSGSSTRKTLRGPTDNSARLSDYEHQIWNAVRSKSGLGQDARSQGSTY